MNSFNGLILLILTFLFQLITPVNGNDLFDTVTSFESFNRIVLSHDFTYIYKDSRADGNELLVTLSLRNACLEPTKQIAECEIPVHISTLCMLIQKDIDVLNMEEVTPMTHRLKSEISLLYVLIYRDIIPADSVDWNTLTASFVDLLSGMRWKSRCLETQHILTSVSALLFDRIDLVNRESRITILKNLAGLDDVVDVLRGYCDPDLARLVCLLAADSTVEPSPLLMDIANNPRYPSKELYWSYTKTNLSLFRDALLNRLSRQLKELNQSDSSTRRFVFDALCDTGVWALKADREAATQLLVNVLSTERECSTYALIEPKLGFNYDTVRKGGVLTLSEAALSVLCSESEFRIRDHRAPAGWAEWIDFAYCGLVLAEQGHGVDWHLCPYVTFSRSEWCDPPVVGVRSFSSAFEAEYGTVIGSPKNISRRPSLVSGRLGKGFRFIMPWEEEVKMADRVPFFISGPSLRHLSRQWYIMTAMVPTPRIFLSGLKASGFLREIRVNDQVGLGLSLQGIRQDKKPRLASCQYLEGILSWETVKMRIEGLVGDVELDALLTGVFAHQNFPFEFTVIYAKPRDLVNFEVWQNASTWDEFFVALESHLDGLIYVDKSGVVFINKVLDAPDQAKLERVLKACGMRNKN